jgi:Methyltransferase domain
VLTTITKRFYQTKKRLSRRWLLAKMPKNAVCAEIGVYTGRFSQRIVDFTRPARLHLIDPWRYQPSEAYEKSYFGAEVAGGQESMERRYNHVTSMFSSEISAGSIVVHRAESGKAAAEFKDHYFDWIYVDGNHLYEFVRDDLYLFLPKIRPGGYICGDDYHDRRTWFEGGVKRAVDEFIAAGKAKPVFLHGDQFILRV